jgi:hypothetical protein
MRTEESINKEARAFVFFKLLACFLTIVACAALWNWAQQWSTLSKLLACGALLVVLLVSFIVGVLELAASTNSSSINSALVNVSGWANIAIALAGLLVVTTAVALL